MEFFLYGYVLPVAIFGLIFKLATKGKMLSYSDRNIAWVMWVPIVNIVAITDWVMS